MSTYWLTPAAQRDLSSIWDYTEKTWGQAQAESYLAEIGMAFERITREPDRGRACDDIRPGETSQSAQLDEPVPGIH